LDVETFVLVEPLVGVVEELVEVAVEVTAVAHASPPVTLGVVLVLLVPLVRRDGPAFGVAAVAELLDVVVVLLARQALDVAAWRQHDDGLGRQVVTVAASGGGGSPHSDAHGAVLDARGGTAVIV